MKFQPTQITEMVRLKNPKTNYREIIIDIPRDRVGSFNPKPAKRCDKVAGFLRSEAEPKPAKCSV